MGRRKQKKVVKKRKRAPKLDTEFNCPFCHHTKSIGIKLNRQSGVADLGCRVCGVSYTVKITRLDEAVDVYSSWIDKCIEVNDALENGEVAEKGLVAESGDSPTAIGGDHTQVSTISERGDISTVERYAASQNSVTRETDGEEEEEYDKGVDVSGKNYDSGDEKESNSESEPKKRRLHRAIDRYRSSDNEDGDANALFGQDDD